MGYETGEVTRHIEISSDWRFQLTVPSDMLRR